MSSAKAKTINLLLYDGDLSGVRASIFGIFSL